jgi:predicted AlkP superfamily pyrophosphatase or phosphodiesterase
MPTSALIPVDMLDYFESSQPPIFKPNALGKITTLFDVLRKNNINFKFIAQPLTKGDDDTFNKAIESVEKGNYSFWFIKFGNLDSLGHIFGPKSHELRKELKKIDSLVEQIMNQFRAKYSNSLFIILSDHGMIEVNKKVDLTQELTDLNLCIPKDYIFFLDSTMARFWFFNQIAKKKITSKLSDIKEGYMPHITNLEQLGINNIGYRYFEEIFVLNERNIFFPDFFWRSTPPKGMHGYAHEVSSKPILIFSNSDIEMKEKKCAHFADIMPTILELLNLEIPEYCEGESLLSEGR